MRLLYLLLSLMILSSCNLQKRCAALYPPARDTAVQRQDSVQIKEVITFRDVPVYLLGDSIIIRDTIPCGGNYTSKAKGKYVSADVSVSNGVLNVKCKTDSLLRIIAQISDTLRTTRENSKEKTTITVTRVVTQKVPKPYVPWWVWLLLSASVLYWGWKFRPGITSFFSKLTSRWKT